MIKRRPLWLPWVAFTFLFCASPSAYPQSKTWDQLLTAGLKASEKGDYAEAERLLSAAVKAAEAFGPKNPRLTTSLRNLAEVYKKQAEDYKKQGKYAEAEPLYRRALATAEEGWGPQGPEVAKGLSDLGQLYLGQGRFADAEPLHRQALAVLEKARGPGDLQVAATLRDLGFALEGQHKSADAEPLLRRALAIQEQTLGADHLEVAFTLSFLAKIPWDESNYAEAERLLRQALVIAEKRLPPDDPRLASTRQLLADSLNKQGEVLDSQDRFAEAEPLHRQALAILEKAPGPADLQVAATLRDLGVALAGQRKNAEAKQLLNRALAIQEQAPGKDHLEVAKTVSFLGKIAWGEANYAEADQLLRRMLAILEEKKLPPDNQFVVLGRKMLADMHDEQSRYEAAAANVAALVLRVLSESKIEKDTKTKTFKLKDTIAEVPAGGWEGTVFEGPVSHSAVLELLWIDKGLEVVTITRFQVAPLARGRSESELASEFLKMGPQELLQVLHQKGGRWEGSPEGTRKIGGRLYHTMAFRNPEIATFDGLYLTYFPEDFQTRRVFFGFMWWGIHPKEEKSAGFARFDALVEGIRFRAATEKLEQ
ncbi:MAG: tetratricopeptide repeat protein [Acidobacteria bacterium]|nr:tetratricopeptide repeat protein [Acidobacteriota bacterium]